MQIKFNTIAAQRRIIVNDKVTKAVFNMNKAEQSIFEEFRGIEMSVEEKVNNSASTVIIELMDEYTGRAKLTHFDKAVFCACLSAQIYGYADISINKIFRYLGGSAEPTESEHKQIVDSLTRLMMCIVDVDCSELNKKSRYRFKKRKFRAPILPGTYEETDINGRTVKVFRFYEQSPLFEIAQIKKQILTIPLIVYTIKGLRNTPRVTAIKEFVIQRVVEYKKAKDKKHLADSILLSEIYHAADLDTPTKKQAQDVREIVQKVMDNLVEKHVLESYQFILRGRTYYSVKFVAVEEDNDAENSIGDLVEISS